MAKTAFKIPLQTEVSLYIQNKMGWPKKFCDHYGDKFWNHYQASGWKLSNGNAIKDWQACFNSQWKQIKYKEDQELLNSMAPKNGVKMNVSKGSGPIEKLDAFIDSFRAPGSDVKFSDFGQWYEFMKAEKLLKPMLQRDVALLREVYGEDNQKCRCAVVKDTLTGYVNNNLRVSDILKMRERLNNQ